MQRKANYKGCSAALCSDYRAAQCSAVQCSAAEAVHLPPFLQLVSLTSTAHIADVWRCSLQPPSTSAFLFIPLIRWCRANLPPPSLSLSPSLSNIKTLSCNVLPIPTLCLAYYSKSAFQFYSFFAGGDKWWSLLMEVESLSFKLWWKKCPTWLRCGLCLFSISKIARNFIL